MKPQPWKPGMRRDGGHLVVLEELGKRVVGSVRMSFLLVQCDCGARIELPAGLMKKKRTCGGADCEHLKAARDASRRAYRSQLRHAEPKDRPRPKHETPAVLLAPLPKKPPPRRV